MINDGIKATGLVSIYRNGVLETQENLVVTLGKQWIAQRCVGAASSLITHIGVGTGTAAAAAADTQLQAEVTRVALSQASSATGAVIRAEAVFSAGVGTGALTEAGLFTAASAGTMVARTVFAVKNKGPEDVFTVVWEITIS